MSTSSEALRKQRTEERIAREKARIDKLRELNLKKYTKEEEPKLPTKNSASNIPVSTKNAPLEKIQTTAPNEKTKNTNHTEKTKNIILQNIKSQSQIRKPNTVSHDKKQLTQNNKDGIKPKATLPISKSLTNFKTVPKMTKPLPKAEEPKVEKPKPKELETKKRTNQPNYHVTNKIQENINKIKEYKFYPKKLNKSLAPAAIPKENISNMRKSVGPSKIPLSASKANPRESVFDRLYKPKVVTKKEFKPVDQIHNDPNYLKKIIKQSGLILDKRHTTFEARKEPIPPVRRSISAVHFKKISKSELQNCLHKWSSIGENMDKIHLKEVNEDEAVKEEKIVSAIKSGRNKVKFQTPMPFYLEKPQELQDKLKSWLHKRGKSLDSYHHLQCFGLHHLASRIKPINLDKEIINPYYDEENKENISVSDDTDTESYSELNIKEDTANKLDANMDKWRRASCITDSPNVLSPQLNESHESNLSVSEAPVHQADELVAGALADLTELLKEGFEWEQSARWLRAIRERFPSFTQTAAYWECRAVLEECRGNLPASVQCWEEAIAKGTEHSVVESNLDQLLDKFMRLRISPNSKQVTLDPRLLDVKNVFKSTIIRFAVQQAKLLAFLSARIVNLPYTLQSAFRTSVHAYLWSVQISRRLSLYELLKEHLVLRHVFFKILSRSTQSQKKYTVTPVRRSARLSHRPSISRTPLQICTSVRQACLLNAEFVPNGSLYSTP